MRIYIKDLNKPDEFLKVVNTHSSDDIFLPLPGESIFSDYVVVRREWLSFEPGQEKAIIWTQRRDSDVIDLVFQEVSGIFKKSDVRTIYSCSISREAIQESIIPSVNDTIELDGKNYRVREVKKIGNFLRPKEIIFNICEV